MAPVKVCWITVCTLVQCSPPFFFFWLNNVVSQKLVLTFTFKLWFHKGAHFMKSQLAAKISIKICWNLLS